MKIILRYSGKLDGSNLPPGSEVDLEASEAESLVRRKLADYLPDSEPAPLAPARRAPKAAAGESSE